MQINDMIQMHPTALWAPFPSTKGVFAAGNLSITSFLPSPVKSIEQILVASDFGRPFFANTPRSLVHMFDDEEMLAGLASAKISAAQKTFQVMMQAFSGVVSARKFDANGLSQGMPFVWKALDPNVAPYSASIWRWALGCIPGCSGMCVYVQFSRF